MAKPTRKTYSADDGGLHDWTSQGSLRSEPLNQAIFSLPVEHAQFRSSKTTTGYTSFASSNGMKPSEPRSPKSKREIKTSSARPRARNSHQTGLPRQAPRANPVWTSLRRAVPAPRLTSPAASFAPVALPCDRHVALADRRAIPHEDEPAILSRSLTPQYSARANAVAKVIVACHGHCQCFVSNGIRWQLAKVALSLSMHPHLDQQLCLAAPAVRLEVASHRAWRRGLALWY